MSNPCSVTQLRGCSAAGLFKTTNSSTFSAAHGIAVREVRLKERRCDYLLLIDRKPAQEKPWTTKLWIYDLRTNLHFTLNEWSSCDIG